MNEVVRVSTTPKVVRVRLWSELAGLTLMIMELVWVASFYNTFSFDRVSWWKIFLVMGVLMMGSHYLSRAMAFFQLSLRSRRIIFGAWLVIGLLGSLKTLVLANQDVSLFFLITHPFSVISPDEGASLGQFWHLLLASILIWRGVTLSHAPVSATQAQRSFQIGLLIFILYGLTISAFKTPVNSFAELYAFLAAGILSMSAARIAGVSELRGGRAGKFSRDWFAGISAFALVLVALSIVTAVVIQRPVSYITDQITRMLLALLSVILLILTYPFIWLISFIFPYLVKLFSDMPQVNVLEDIGDMLGQYQGEQSQLISGLVGAANYGRILGRIGIIVGIGLAILAALRWRAQIRAAGAEEQAENLPARLRFPGIPPIQPRGILDRLIHPARWLAAARIRRIYAELMDTCESLGRPRPEAVTPLEFLPTGETLFPEFPAELRTITNAYLKVRYGELPETQQEVNDCQEAWNKIRGQARKTLAAQKQAVRKEKSNRPNFE